MTTNLARKSGQGMTSARPGASRKLLSRKAAEKVGSVQLPGQTIEDSFPVAAGVISAEVNVLFDGEAELGTSTFLLAPVPADAQQAPTRTATLVQPSAASAWSSENESAFQALAVRRKAAGYSRRGKDVSDQLIMLGTIKPNPGTVVAVIAALVAEHGGSVRRADLITAMASAIFTSGKAKPTDVDWCQGYVAGAVRNGFLAADAGRALSDVA